MDSTGHTFGPNCALRHESNIFTRRASSVAQMPPKMKAHFFYSSALPIDDPLSPVPPPSSNPAGQASKLPPRPFSIIDNAALEKAWLGIHDADETLPTASDPIPMTASAGLQPSFNNVQSMESSDEIGPSEPSSHDHRRLSKGDPHLTLCDDPSHIPFDYNMPVSSDEIGNDEFESGTSRIGRWGTFKRRDTPYPSSPSDTTGTPFLRVSSRLKRATSRSRSRRAERDTRTRSSGGTDDTFDDGGPADTGGHDPNAAHGQGDLIADRKSSDQEEKQGLQASITVGASRLHIVTMPDLQMGPIYWDPVHDISAVVRGTWFYRDTMLPVDTDVANQLEEGYDYMRPWTLTYSDEVRSCLEVGPEAELKVTHRLWPLAETKDDSRPNTGKSQSALRAQGSDSSKSEDSGYAADSDFDYSRNPIARGLEPDDEAMNVPARSGNAPALFDDIENQAAGILSGKENTQKYRKSSVIYANPRDAQILRSNQVPSVSRGRRPLGPIIKGRTIGIAVVRGFDHKAWEKIHLGKAQNVAVQGVQVLRTATAIATDLHKECAACVAEATPRPAPTDLILVIHGIGQKLSERVESFHFTHAINAFRRQVNLELESDAVRPRLRESVGSFMVLPVNWRARLKLEEGGPNPVPNQKNDEASKNQFNLKDITPESIPAIRNLISDVMLDIPYYLSQHKEKMIRAVVKEANRIYRLWCKNNPDFHETGRVHIIAHSLGSVMTLDVLSRQPTRLPQDFDLNGSKPRRDIFDFDTKNVFFCGSPAGLFLYLNRAPLLPRKGRNKPDSNGDDLGAGVAGEAGSYGCLAVDNLYNVMHITDPVTFGLNACVDVDYASSIQKAFVPTATATWAETITSLFGKKPQSKTPANFVNPSKRPNIASMPSTVELETHNFSREEIAEKRMLLMNDNGQIDFILKSTGGPLEIQYLNMLSAHSSYWISRDFVRFVVCEVGREAGREEASANLRALKKRRR